MIFIYQPYLNVKPCLPPPPPPGKPPYSKPPPPPPPKNIEKMSFGLKSKQTKRQFKKQKIPSYF